MGIFNKAVVTEKGQALLAKTVAGTCKMVFTKVSLSENTLKGNLSTLSNIGEVKQSTHISRKTVRDNASVVLEAVFTNADLNRGYSVRNIGLYAQDPDEGEILYSISTADESKAPADWIAPYVQGGIITTFTIELVTTVANASNVEIEVDPACVATLKDIAEVNEKIITIQVQLAEDIEELYKTLFPKPSEGLIFDGDMLVGVGTCKDSIIVVPEYSPEGVRVTRVGMYAFGYNSEDDISDGDLGFIESIIFPPPLTYYAEWAIHTNVCNNLKSVYMFNLDVIREDNGNPVFADAVGCIRDVYFFNGTEEQWVTLNTSYSSGFIGLKQANVENGIVPTKHFYPPDMIGTVGGADINHTHETASYEYTDVNIADLTVIYPLGGNAYVESDGIITLSGASQNYPLKLEYSGYADIELKVTEAEMAIDELVISVDDTELYRKYPSVGDIFKFSGNINEGIKLSGSFTELKISKFKSLSGIAGFMAGEDKAKLDKLVESMGDFDTALDELHAYAQSVITGGASE